MTTKINLANTFNTLKNMLYALQVIILVLAIPLLSYIELSHTDNSQEKNTGRMINKSEVIADNLSVIKSVKI
jgi:hypothetical protein